MVKEDFLELFDLRDVSNRIGLPIRRLRYVLEQELVPNRTWFVVEDDVGHPRRFDRITAVYIACAAFLLEAGHKRDAIRELMEAISKVQPEGRNPFGVPTLAHAVLSQVSATVKFGDGRYVRWIVGKKDSGWVDPESPQKKLANCEPKIVVDINFGVVRDLVCGKPNTP